VIIPCVCFVAQAEAHESGARFSVVFSPETLTLPSP
jgi:hypothetical protein